MSGGVHDLPEEAMEAATKALAADEERRDYTKYRAGDQARIVLVAAAPAIRAAAVEEERERLARKERPGLPPILQVLHDAAPGLAIIVMAALTVAEEEAMKELARLTLVPFTEAKPMPGRGDDIYRIEVPGEALRAAKTALAALDSDSEEEGNGD